MNTNKIIITILTTILIIVCLFNCKVVNDLEDKTLELIELTNIEPEIVFLESVEHDSIYIEKYDSIKLTKCQFDTITLNDTIIIIDSVDVVIPIELKHYHDTLQNVGIFFNLSGFQCEVNNLYVKNFLSVPTQEKAVKRWYEDIHLGAGLSVTYIDKFRLVPTFGIYYKLF